MAITCVQAAGTESFKTMATGVIRDKMGTARFSSDMMTVKMDLAPLSSMAEVLHKSHTQIGLLLQHKKRENVNENVINLLQVEFDKITTLLPKSGSRSKRSLLPWGGNILHSVFGTATDSQVIEVEKKVGNLEKWARSKGHLLHKTIQRVDSQTNKIDELNEKLKHELEGTKIQLMVLLLTSTTCYKFGGHLYK